MPELELSPTAQQWVNVTLIWVGFGTLAGLLAKALIPGRQPSSAVGTVLIGIMGSVAGPLSLCFLLKRQAFNPVSPLGFLAAVAGALALLIVYRILFAVFTVSRNEDHA